MEFALALLLVAQSPMPIAFVERPITVPEDSFELIFELGGSYLDDDAPVVTAETGARYGITPDFEIGLTALRLSMSPAKNTGLNEPTGFLKYRVFSGVFELAARAEIELPVGGVFEAMARVEGLLRLGSVARIDLSPQFFLFVEDPIRYAVSAPVELTFQLSDHVQLSAVGIVDVLDLRRAENVLGRAGLRFRYTFGENGRATADLGILLTSPNLALAGERPVNPAFNNYFLALVDLRWFLANDQQDAWQGFD